MKTYNDWRLEECVNSAAKALEKSGIKFEKEGETLRVSKEDMDRAKAVVKANADDPKDIRFLQS